MKTRDKIEMKVLDYHSKARNVVCFADERDEIIAQCQYRVQSECDALDTETVTDWLDADNNAISQADRKQC